MLRRAKTTLLLILPTLGLITALDTAIGLNHIVWLSAIFCAGLYILGREWPRLSVPADDPSVWTTIGVLYLFLLPFLCGLYLLPRHAEWILWGAVLTTAADVSANIFGRLLRGPKLLPRISPNKTWSGFLGALLSCILLAWYFNLPHGPLGAALLVTVATGGDMLESWLKRRRGIKDSGTLLPGHGGLFDRLDGHIAVQPLNVLLYLLHG